MVTQMPQTRLHIPTQASGPVAERLLVLTPPVPGLSPIYHHPQRAQVANGLSLGSSAGLEGKKISRTNCRV